MDIQSPKRCEDCGAMMYLGVDHWCDKETHGSSQDAAPPEITCSEWVGGRPCVACGEETNVVFNIRLRATPICESCANSITRQQVAALCSPTDQAQVSREAGKPSPEEHE